MELPWSIKLRIIAALLIGIVMVGLPGWLLIMPGISFVSVMLQPPLPGLAGAVGLLALAFLAGLLAYFACLPYGRQIAPIAVPAGLSIWAIRSGSLAELFRLNPALQQRQAIYAALKWEGFYWLAVVAAGFCAVLCAEKIFQRNRPAEAATQAKKQTKSNTFLNAVSAVLASSLLVYVCIGIFVQDVRIFDSKLGAVLGQPAVGQIAFGVVVSFGIAGFLVKKFLDVGYIWCVISTSLVVFSGMRSAGREMILQHLIRNWPTVFFHHCAGAILPVQMVAFGAVGALAGFWLAVRYNYWRKHVGTFKEAVSDILT